MKLEDGRIYRQSEGVCWEKFVTSSQYFRWHKLIKIALGPFAMARLIRFLNRFFFTYFQLNRHYKCLESVQPATQCGRVLFTP